MDWESEDPTLYRLLAAAHRRADAIAADVVFELGLTPIEARVLGAIASDEHRVHATGLARRLGLPVSTVTRALRRLERVAYIGLEKGTAFDARLLAGVPKPAGRRVGLAVCDLERDVDRELVAGMSGLVKGALYSGLLHIVCAEQSARATSPQA